MRGDQYLQRQCLQPGPGVFLHMPRLSTTVLHGVGTSILPCLDWPTIRQTAAGEPVMPRRTFLPTFRLPVAAAVAAALLLAGCSSGGSPSANPTTTAAPAPGGSAGPSESSGPPTVSATGAYKPADAQGGRPKTSPVPVMQAAGPQAGRRRTIGIPCSCGSSEACLRGTYGIRTGIRVRMGRHQRGAARPLKCLTAGRGPGAGAVHELPARVGRSRPREPVPHRAPAGDARRD